MLLVSILYDVLCFVTISTLVFKELRDEAEELKKKLENSLPLLNHVTEQCSHSDHLRDVQDLIEKFFAFTKGLFLFCTVL